MIMPTVMHQQLLHYICSYIVPLRVLSMCGPSGIHYKWCRCVYMLKNTVSTKVSSLQHLLSFCFSYSMVQFTLLYKGGVVIHTQYKKMCSMVSFLFQLCDVNSSTLEEWYIYHVDYGILYCSVVWCKLLYIGGVVILELCAYQYPLLFCCLV